MARFSVEGLHKFCRAVLTKSGAADEKIDAVANVLIEGECLGYQTHGLQRLSYNYECLLKAQPGQELAIKGNTQQPVFLVDGAFEAGPWVITKTVAHAAQLSRTFGIGLGVVKKSDHIACAAAYMPPLIDKGLIGLILAATPSERVVCSPTGYHPITSNTPLAFCAPGDPDPVLFDFTTAAASLGSIALAEFEKRKLPEAVLRKTDGSETDDPSELFKTPPANVLPFGGALGRHKGFALSLMIEILAFGLTGYGVEDGAEDGEANSAVLLVIDPSQFAGVEAVRRVVASFQAQMNVPQSFDARIPGARGWKLRDGAHRSGIAVNIKTLSSLQTLAKQVGVELPLPI